MSNRSADQHGANRQTINRQIQILLFGTLGVCVKVVALLLLDEVADEGDLDVGQVLRECDVLVGAARFFGFAVTEAVFDYLLDFVFVFRFVTVE